MPIRSVLIPTALIFGLVGGAVVWSVFGTGHWESRELSALETRAETGRTVRLAYASHADLSAQAASTPLFALTAGPGAVAEPNIRLEGIANSAGGRSALVAIDGKPAEWLQLGATRDGVTLQQVQGSKIIIDTATGFKQVGMGEPAAPSDAPRAR